MLKNAPLATTLLALTIGCGAHDEAPTSEHLGSTASPITLDNGRTLNGRTLNGRTLNGRDLTGHMLVAVSYSNITLRNGRVLRASRLDGAELTGLDERGARVDGKRLEGATLNGVLDDGSALKLRIGAVSREGRSDVYRYTVSYEEASGMQPLCGWAASGEELPAIPLNGVWNYADGVPGGGSFSDDPSAFTFACEGFALAKCVDLGYRPWASKTSCGAGGCTETSLAVHHQACTRLLRADYCGDGSSHTADGIQVNLYDSLGIQSDTESWAINAEWDADGARCVLQGRTARTETAACWSELLADDCGKKNHFKSGTLLMSEVSSR